MSQESTNLVFAAAIIVVTATYVVGSAASYLLARRAMKNTFA